MRTTKKQQRILNLLKFGGLFTANQICKEVPDIDKATVYRTLHKFVDLGEVREISIRDGEKSYEYNDDIHQHFICSDCGKVMPVYVDEEKLRNLIELDDFEIDSIELNIKGRCKLKKIVHRPGG